MLFTKSLLTLVGLAYVGLAAWCALRPGPTSNAVGFELKPGAGQSEYLVIYGGLQLALGLAFLSFWARADLLTSALWLCLLIHAVLVVFRSASLMLYSGIPTTTYVLAAVEWAILLATAGCLFWNQK